MFWNDGHNRLYGRHLRNSGLHKDQAIIQMDGGWDGFTASMPSDETLVSMTPAELAEQAGFDPEILPKAISNALRNWRVSPSSSLVNILGEAEQGSAGQPMFRDLKTQTRVLAAAIEAEAIVERTLRAVTDENNKPIQIAVNAWAMTALDEAATNVNALARAFRLWEERNRAMVRTGRVKLPKAVWRGIRSRDVNLDIEPDLPESQPWNIRACELSSLMTELLSSKPLAQVSHSEILSFTANERIAEFFTKNEGFVVEADPAAMTVVASWSTDDVLSGPDYVTNRQEREWIMRVGNLVLAPEKVRAHYNQVAWSTGDPRGIEMIDGTTKAYYRMNGRQIEAFWAWNANGTGGKLRFKVDREWSQTRAEVKKAHGFDPIPREGDVVEELVYRSCDTWGMRPEKDIEQWNRETRPTLSSA